MDDTEIDIRSIIGLLRRQLYLIMAVIVVSLGLAAIAIFALSPIYTATALVMVDPNPKDLLDNDAQLGSSAANNARIDSEVELIRSEATLLRVIRERGLITDEEFGVQLSSTDRLMTWLRLSDGTLPTGDEALRSVLVKVNDALSVSRRGLTYLISVSFSSGSPQVAAEMSNAVASAYIQDQLEAKVQGALAVRDILNARIVEATSAISESEEALEGFVFANIDRISSETGNTELSELTQRFQNLEIEREQVERLASLISQDIESQGWESLSQNLGLEAVAELARQRSQLVADLAETETGTTRAVDLANELSAIEREIEQAGTRELGQLRQSALDAQATAIDLRQEIRLSAISSELPADLLTEIYKLQQNASIARTQYQTLLSRLREVETQVDLQVADSRVASPALPPNSAAFPNKPLILMLAGIAGLGLGVGLAFLNEHYVGGFTSPAQMEAVLKTPVLAAIPRLKPGALPKSGNPGDAIIEAPLSSFSESIRRLRAGVDQAVRRAGKGVSEESKGMVVMVCSAVPGEGKTTVALALARAYALSGQRTLLVDADMRRPSVHKQLQMDPELGLFDYLTNDTKSKTLSAVLSKDEASGLNVLVGARGSNVPTDQLFASKRFAALIDSSVKHFDIIILDTPPVGPVVDALYLAQYVDYLTFVVRATSTSQSDVRAALSRLRGALAEEADVAIALNQQVNGNLGNSAGYEGYYDEL